MIDGVKINMAGQDFIVPPLNFKRLKTLRPLLSTLNSDPVSSNLTDEQLEAAVTIVHMALSRNYPDIEKDRVEELLDLGNLPGVLAAIMGQSGLQKGE